MKNIGSLLELLHVQVYDEYIPVKLTLCFGVHTQRCDPQCKLKLTYICSKFYLSKLLT